jgi:hypothetical protein
VDMSLAVVFLLWVLVRLVGVRYGRVVVIVVVSGHEVGDVLLRPVVVGDVDVLVSVGERVVIMRLRHSGFLLSSCRLCVADEMRHGKVEMAGNPRREVQL